MLEYMFWADEIAGEIEKRFAKEITAGTPLVIRDEKTLSGRVHVGSLRGIVLHGAIAEVLSQRNIANTFMFELNDFDPMDGLPINIDQEKFRPFMGKPLYRVPSPDDRAENFPMFYGDEIQEVVHMLGLPIEFYPLLPLYKEGKFNDVIKQALDHADAIRTIYLQSG